MKPSSYNVFSEREGVVWGFNTRSAAFVRLTPQQHARVRQLLAEPSTAGDGAEHQDLYQGLVRGQFLIPDATDELALLKVKHRVTRFAARGIGLIIAPTLRCNFACPYCYVDRNANKMKPENREKVKRFFANRLLEESSVSVCWTGGDPSLAMDVVEELSAAFLSSCEEKRASYDAVLITNGYLLDRRMLGALQRSRIRALQITLDGARQFHDSTRALAGGRPTYDRILGNVEAVCDEIRVNLRINVDGHNYRSVPAVLEDLARRGLGGKVAVHFAHVEAVNEPSAGYREHCLTTERFAALELQFIEAAHSRGLRLCGGGLNRPLATYCGANSLNHFVIDPHANLLKCYEDLGNADRHGIGHIDDDGHEAIQQGDNLTRWLSWDPFELEECRGCKVLPLCMGGCSYHSVRGGLGVGPGCLKLKHNLDEILELYGERLSQKREQAVSACSPAICAHL